MVYVMVAMLMTWDAVVSNLHPPDVIMNAVQLL